MHSRFHDRRVPPPRPFPLPQNDEGMTLRPPKEKIRATPSPQSFTVARILRDRKLGTTEESREGRQSRIRSQQLRRTRRKSHSAILLSQHDFHIRTGSGRAVSNNANKTFLQNSEVAPTAWLRRAVGRADGRADGRRRTKKDCSVCSTRQHAFTLTTDLA